MKTISWLFFRVRIPLDWEMRRYSLTHESGLCVFSDALSERLRLSWRRVSRMPGELERERDLRRRLQDVRRHLERKRRGLRFDEIRPVAGNWIGVHVAGERRAWIAARYLHAEGDDYLVEAEVNAELDDGAAALDVLSSFRARDPGVWCAYHIHARIPDEWRIAAARIFPGSSELEFRKGEEVLQLFSVNPLTTDLTIENMIGRLMHAKERIVERKEVEKGPHRFTAIETRRLAARGFIGRLKRVHDLYVYSGWLCENRPQPRVFLVRYRRQSPTGCLPDGVEVYCCRR